MKTSDRARASSPRRRWLYVAGAVIVATACWARYQLWVFKERDLYVLKSAYPEPEPALLRYDVPVNRSAPASEMPWKVERELTSASNILNPNYYTTFSLAHNCFHSQDNNQGYGIFLDLDSGQLASNVNLRTSLDPRSHAVSVVQDDRSEPWQGGSSFFGSTIMGEGNWALVWGSGEGISQAKFFVSFAGPRHRVVPLQGSLPGLGLYNVVTADGSFISIRADIPAKYGPVDTYRLSVYGLKDAKSTLLPATAKDNPFWRWSGAVIPQLQGVTAESRVDGSLPEGAPEMFTTDGRALAKGYVRTQSDQGSGVDLKWFEWSQDGKSWSPVEVRGHKDAKIAEAFYAGSCLFAKDNSGSWWCRKADGSWHFLGDISILARNGGTHLIVRLSYTEPKALIVRVD